MSDAKQQVWVPIVVALIGAGAAIVAAYLANPRPKPEVSGGGSAGTGSNAEQRQGPDTGGSAGLHAERPKEPEAASAGAGSVEKQPIKQERVRAPVQLPPALKEADIEKGLRGIDTAVATACAEACGSTVGSADLEIVINGAGRVAEVSVRSMSGGAPREGRVAPRGHIGDAGSCAMCVANVIKLRRFPEWMGPTLTLRRTVQVQQVVGDREP